ncbi:Plant UBX domain-containing protein [Drosera capensis]
MARPDQDAIETYMSITGSTKAVAVERLEEHGGNLNEAVNAFFNEGDRNVAQDADFMDIDDPVEPQPRVAPSLLSASGPLDPSSLLDESFRRRMLDARSLLGSSPDFFDRAHYVSHPREVRQIPIEFKDGTASSGPSGRGPTIKDVKDGTASSGPSGHGPTIEDVTDTEYAPATEARGRVVIDEEKDYIPTRPAQNLGVTGWGDRTSFTHSRPNVTELDDMSDYGNDIEEEFIRAAIEASKKDTELQKKQDLDQGSQQGPSNFEDEELEHVVALSLKTAERERELQEEALRVGASGPSENKPIEVEELKPTAESSEKASTRVENEARGSLIIEEDDEEDEQPLVWRRPRRGSSSSVEARQIVDAVPPSSPQHAAASHIQPNGESFPSDEWGGISSEEHDEAVMLEAAMFGVIPEGTNYRFAYGPHSFARPAPRPPSPGLTAQRLIREQQDDEYLAALQADRERELKAIEEEKAVKEAALVEQRQKEEQSRRQLEEEQELERQLAAKEASLPAEPAADNDNAVTLLVRMPNSNRHGRRFLRTDKLQALFDFIDVGRTVKPGTYRVVRPFPRRAFSDEDSNVTLSELGLTSKQEALFLELI